MLTLNLFEKRLIKPLVLLPLFFCSFFFVGGWVLRLRSGNGKGVFGRRDMRRKRRFLSGRNWKFYRSKISRFELIRFFIS